MKKLIVFLFLILNILSSVFARGSYDMPLMLSMENNNNVQ